MLLQGHIDIWIESMFPEYAGSNFQTDWLILIKKTTCPQNQLSKHYLILIYKCFYKRIWLFSMSL